MKGATIGILAGMGPRSTAPFIERVVTQCQLQYGAKDDIDFPRMMIFSLPTPFYAEHPTDHQAMEAALADGLQELQSTGVDFIAIACNSAHVYFRSLVKTVQVPVLNMVELALDAMPESTRRIAVVTARLTAESGIYAEGILARGKEWVDVDWQSRVDDLIESTRSPQRDLLFKQRWADLIKEAEKQGAEAILVACADLSAILPHAESHLPLLDSTECLAYECIRRWREITSQQVGQQKPPLVEMVTES